MNEKDSARSGEAGFYWKYESRLKVWDSCLYSTVSAAGELFAIRTTLFEAMPPIRSWLTLSLLLFYLAAFCNESN